MCDECETLWIEPSTDSKKSFPRTANPLCPVCDQPLYGAQSRWAQPEDVVADRAWAAAAIFELPTPLEQQNTMDLLVMDDIATDLDSPPAVPGGEGTQVATNLSPESNSLPADSSYGQDDPKPGC
jgi:hypothetical protein